LAKLFGAESAFEHPKGGNVNSEMNLLQGTWNIAALEVEGQNIPKSEFENARLIIEGNRFTSLGMGTTYEGTIDVNPSVTPRQFEMNFDAGPEKGNKNLVFTSSMATRGEFV
jgi:uncharacterized protein (TIGR03067 family)